MKIFLLTHWGRATHICVGELTIIVSDNGLSPGRRQAIFWTNAGILLIGALGTNVSEILIKICAFSLKELLLKMSSGKKRPSCLGLNVLNSDPYVVLLTGPNDAGVYLCCNADVVLQAGIQHFQTNTLWLTLFTVCTWTLVLPVYDAMWCCDNVVNFLPNPHNRHPITGKVWGVFYEHIFWLMFCPSYCSAVCNIM